MKIDHFYIVGVLSRVKQMLNYTSPGSLFSYTNNSYSTTVVSEAAADV